ncbi:hypothetical protein ES703_101669 [subsurface metagenome]
MRNWYKYTLSPYYKHPAVLPIDKDFEDHKVAMGGYDAAVGYKSKEDFFNRWFFGYHMGRLQHYDEFIRKHLRKDEAVLSIGSGRCANELYLMEDGYNITCSDLGLIDCYNQTLSLFPNFKFIELNMLNSVPPRKYDTTIVLGLIYLFNGNELATFFKNVSNGLKLGGHLILDSAGASDNLFTYFLDEILLRCETYLIKTKTAIEHKQYTVIKKHHGYRKTEREVIKLALATGFKLIDKEYYAFLAEFRRSILFKRLFPVRLYPLLEKIFSIGRITSHVRMFYLEKVREPD